MPPRNTPTARQLRVGLELRKMRDSARKTTADAASILGLDRTKITQIEKGLYAISPDRVRTLAREYQEGDSAYVEALASVAAERGKGWWEEYRGVLPGSLLDISELEHRAEGRIRTLQICHAPGLLQTEDTARAIFEMVHPRLPARDLWARIAHRVERVKVLTRPHAVEYDAIIHEAALRMNFGGKAVARAQLEHIRAMTDRPNITVRVITFDAPGFSGAGNAVLYVGGAVPRLDTVQVDSVHGPIFLDGSDQLDNYRETLNAMERSALSPADSIAFMDDLLKTS
ncbi:helix-turn-helix transcriptional regulator [Streptomyces kaniharaensis]|uniref:Helix-turn-helix transcriptional regulator n=1 Tax=Streptomyces kaniharaensis TaxID=212423 RepID=A0A6N7KQL3_9ACTN|nr:Scr1 family TA system antitoxin-like transcriptional regulator [Streptomyces kaniharaensis]MQS13035.1 helix-turn-helix transcriptional regulator [Streptomyces kaniharaensis]